MEYYLVYQFYELRILIINNQSKIKKSICQIINFKLQVILFHNFISYYQLNLHLLLLILYYIRYHNHYHH